MQNELEKIIDESGKITDIIIKENNKLTTIRKVEPVNGKSTSSTIIQSKDSISLQMQ